MDGGRRLVRCAVYTRKSSEHGLEQDFNSLAAQREAAEAYILSQRHEGWRLVKTRYDDGGISGGTLERPGLQRLLADIDARRIDVVVVYKVDRLTRSLADFAKLVESFERYGVSFVSVTQQFNTTTSMGRLTLNVLLSFAQFEREIAGERIRDKFAASRRKGIWMGGHPPLGYDIHDRKLVVNDTEAAQVCRIFDLFGRLGCVAKVKAVLDAEGCRSKVRVSTNGRTYGGKPLSRGALYHILKNRLYRGEVNHKGIWYPGDHPAIVSAELWTNAQEILAGHRTDRVYGTRQAAPSLLKGLLFDDAGNRMSPSHARRHGRRYLYYVSQALLQHRPQAAGSVARLPAHAIEVAVTDRIARLLSDPDRLALQLGISDPASRETLVRMGQANSAAEPDRTQAVARAMVRAVVTKVIVGRDRITIVLARAALLAHLLDRRAGETSGQEKRGGEPDSDEPDTIELTETVTWRRRGRVTSLELPADGRGADPAPNDALVKAIARGHVWAQKLVSGEIGSVKALGELVGLPERYVSRMLRLGFLAPALVQAILDGRLGSNLKLPVLDNLPLRWADQRRHLGLTS